MNPTLVWYGTFIPWFRPNGAKSALYKNSLTPYYHWASTIQKVPLLNTDHLRQNRRFHAIFVSISPQIEWKRACWKTRMFTPQGFERSLVWKGTIEAGQNPFHDWVSTGFDSPKNLSCSGEIEVIWINASFFDLLLPIGSNVSLQ